MRNIYEDYARRLPEFETLVNSVKENVDALQRLELLKCNGNPPNLQNLSEQDLKRIASMAFTNSNINILPDNHELGCVNFSENPQVLLAKDRASIEAALLRMLKARGYKLSNEVIQFAINVKLNLLYNKVSDALVIMEQELMALPPSPEVEILIRAYKEVAEPLLVNKKRDIESCYTKCLEAFLESLQTAPDASLGIKPKARLERIVSILLSYPEYTLDLRHANLGIIGNYLKEIDIRGVKLRLTPEQEELYLTSEQREQRGGALIRAAKIGDIKKIYELCNIGLVNYKDSQGRTPLMTACMANQEEAVHILLEYGANINDRTTVSNSTIIEGLSRFKDNSPQRGRIVKLLIVKGADVSDLHVAAAFCDLKNMKTLYNAGVVNSKVQGYAPLHIAVIHSRLDNVKWLCVDKKADINMLDDNGLSPLDLAYETGDRNIIGFLISEGAILKANKAIDATIHTGHLLLARELVDRHGCSVGQRRMLGSALKDILIVSRVSKVGFIPGMAQEVMSCIISFVSTSYISRTDALELRSDIIIRNQAAMQRGYVAEVNARPIEEQGQCVMS